MVHEGTHFEVACPGCKGSNMSAEERLRRREALGIAASKKVKRVDEHGYPTEETLNIIKNWDYLSQGLPGWFEFIASVWNYPEEFSSKEVSGKVEWHVHTLGWSGNEEIIMAMRENTIAWALTWVQSRVGGHYIFEIPTVG